MTQREPQTTAGVAHACPPSDALLLDTLRTHVALYAFAGLTPKQRESLVYEFCVQVEEYDGAAFDAMDDLVADDCVTGPVDDEKQRAVQQAVSALARTRREAVPTPG
ncbi:hypothetical protein [Paraburkholderia tropica]|uniref:hypothetical protein n=1 Tax=Paraburkholderia tropica TaxID=92647 RepID=UPI0012E9D845|nr:hypothetical protein [Paraburkholderia tropica]